MSKGNLVVTRSTLFRIAQCHCVLINWTRERYIYVMFLCTWGRLVVLVSVYWAFLSTLGTLVLQRIVQYSRASQQNNIQYCVFAF